MARPIITSLFGKATAITEPDLVKFAADGHRESDILDVKALSNVRFGEQAPSILLKPIVAFLNKLDRSGGVLLLGMSETNQVIDGIAGAPTGQIAEAKVRDLLLSHIGTIPVSRDWTLNAEMIVTAQGDVFAIEVHPDPAPRLYYSKKDNTAYIRRSDKSEQISFADAVQLAESRAHSRTGVEFGQANFTAAPNPTMDAFKEIEIAWHNSGNRPSRDVVTIFNAIMQTQNGKVCFGKKHGGTGWGGQYGGTPQTFQASTGAFNQPLVYPGRGTTLGTLKIGARSGQFSCFVQAETMDEYGQLTQKWILSGDLDSTSQVASHLLDSAYAPYGY